MALVKYLLYRPAALERVRGLTVDNVLPFREISQLAHTSTSLHLHAQNISEWHVKLWSCGLCDFCLKQCCAEAFPTNKTSSVLMALMKEVPNEPDLTRCRFLCSFQPGRVGTCICQRSRREAGASVTRDDQTDCLPASRSSCRATAAQIHDSHELTYIESQHQQQVPVWFCRRRPEKGVVDIKKSSEKGARWARMKGDKKPNRESVLPHNAVLENLLSDVYLAALATGREMPKGDKRTASSAKGCKHEQQFLFE